MTLYNVITLNNIQEKVESYSIAITDARVISHAKEEEEEKIEVAAATQQSGVIYI